MMDVVIPIPKYIPHTNTKPDLRFNPDKSGPNASKVHTIEENVILSNNFFIRF